MEAQIKGLLQSVVLTKRGPRAPRAFIGVPDLKSFGSALRLCPVSAQQTNYTSAPQALSVPGGVIVVDDFGDLWLARY